MNGKAAIFSEDGGLISHRRCRLNSVLAKERVKRKVELLCFFFRKNHFLFAGKV